MEQRQKDLCVHLPGHAIEPIKQMLNASCIFDELLSCRLQFQPLEAGQPVTTHNVRVTPFPTTHLEGLRRDFARKYPGCFQAYSFLLESDLLRIGHTADIGAIHDLEPLVAKPLDLLVCEVAHVRPESLFRFLQGQSIKRIVFIHVSRRHWEDLEETRSLAAKFLRDVPFTFAHDGEEIML